MIGPLDPSHDRAAFSCGIEPLDRYLSIQAGQDMRKHVATCFVLTDDGDPSVLGYYTLSATSLALAGLPDELARKLPRYPVLPATLMGRLAVDCRRRGRRFGELLLLDAFARTLLSEIATYAFVVDAKDEGARAFYEAYGFRRLPSAGRRLFLPVAAIAKLFS